MVAEEDFNFPFGESAESPTGPQKKKIQESEKKTTRRRQQPRRAGFSHGKGEPARGRGGGGGSSRGGNAVTSQCMRSRRRHVYIDINGIHGCPYSCLEATMNPSSLLRVGAERHATLPLRHGTRGCEPGTHKDSIGSGTACSCRRQKNRSCPK